MATGLHADNSELGNHIAISLNADSTESDPWQMFRPTSMQKSPLIVPGAESRGFVAPNIILPVLTTFNPSQTIGTTGPEAIYLTSPGKNPFEDKSA